MKLFNTISRLFRRDTFLMQFLPAVVVLGVLLIFALANWQNAYRSLDAQYKKVVGQRIVLVEDRLEERMQTGGTLVRAGNGLLNGSDSVSRDEWGRFYQQIVGDEKFRASIVGYAPIITADQREEFEEQLHADGVQNNIITKGSPNILVPIQYATQFGNTGSVLYGYDMYSSGPRRKAMEESRDSGFVKMTTPIKLTGSNKSGVIMYIPVYNRLMPTATVAEKRAALRGFVYETLEFQELFNGLSNDKDLSFGYAIEEMTNGKTTPLITTAGAKNLISEGRKPFSQSEVDEYGNSWKISYYASHDVLSSVERSRPVYALIIGLALALVASGMVYSIIKYRIRVFALSEEQKLQRAKDELLSLASHQLRTPATGVKQYVGMVLDGFGGPVPEDQVKLLEQAYKSNERQLQIINDFLYVAKLGSGSLTTTKHKFDIAPLVRDVVEEMNLDIKERNHKIRVDVPKTLPIKADEHSVRMIVENLVSNAIKYTAPGGSLGVELRQGNREIRVIVTDNGVGVAKRDQKMLFKQFSRIPNELSNEVSGSGIGLYLAQQLAMRNGGKITYESASPQGSVFILHLPSWRVKKITMHVPGT